MNFLIETIYHQKYPLSTSYGHLRGKEDQMDILKPIMNYYVKMEVKKQWEKTLLGEIYPSSGMFKYYNTTNFISNSSFKNLCYRLRYGISPRIFILRYLHVSIT